LRHSHAPARPPGPFDLIEFNGSDLRREPIEIRKTQLAKLIRLSADRGNVLQNYFRD